MGIMTIRNTEVSCYIADQKKNVIVFTNRCFTSYDGEAWWKSFVEQPNEHTSAFYIKQIKSYNTQCMLWICDWSSQLCTELKQLWNKAWKKFRSERDSNPWLLRYWCSALPIELSSHLGAEFKYMISHIFTYTQCMLMIMGSLVSQNFRHHQ